ncbi:MAG: S8 family serine peptidase, partial [Propionibacteriales bacterium]|nr:S8 family serine peptidase [Propionibacteriales bacterium]
MRLAQSAVLGLAALVAAGTTGAVSVQAGSAAHRADTPVLAASSHSSDVQLKSKWGNDTTDEGLKASAETGVWQADKDHGSLNWIEKRYGVQDTWSKTDSSGQKITGKGVTVAVIDTGVAPVPGLDDPGKVINGPDLSFDSQDPETRYLDGYGHGTHMAAIIAGRDANLPPGKDGQSRYTDPRYFVGMAPDARILNVKAAASDGGTDVTQVIAAVDWVVQHRNDNGMNVRVINLSYGTRSTQSYLLDPLAKAVENAWRHGIVVVVAAGNDGIASPTLTMPAADPYVVAVGAVDNRGTDGFKDDIVAPFSNGGDKARRPNLIAPGKSVVSLR